MGLLSRYLAGPDPLDDRWYGGGRVVSFADGSATEADSALRVATVWRAVNVLAGAVATLPRDVFRRIDPARPDSGKEVAAAEPLRMKLRLQPNRAQTAFRWIHHMMGHAILGGNYYAHKVGAPRRIEQLWPLDAARMEVVDIRRDGSLVYRYTTTRGAQEILTQDEVLHIRGFSKDGTVGVSVLELMRENVQLALTTKRQRRTFVKNEMRPSVVLTHPGDLGEPAKNNLAKGYQRAYGGEGAGGVLVLDEGMDVKPFQASARDSQYVEGESFQVEEFLRFLGVPGVLVGHPDKTATYASAEQFFQSFVTHSVLPWTENIEQELTASLFGGDQDEIFVEFNIDALLRADATARAAFYRAMVELGVYTRNEVRALENRNPIDGLDEPLTPKNMGTGAEEPEGTRPAPRVRPSEETGEEDDEQARAMSRARNIVRAAVARILRKEVAAIAGTGGKKGAAERYASDPAGWRRWVADFYADHAALVAEVLGIPNTVADGYCLEQRNAVLAEGVRALEDDERGRRLERLALEAE